MKFPRIRGAAKLLHLASYAPAQGALATISFKGRSAPCGPRGSPLLSTSHYPCALRGYKAWAFKMA